MKFSDRQLLSLAAGLLLAAALGGCQWARHRVAENTTVDDAIYDGTVVPEPPGAFREPASAIGPSEPVPVLPPAESPERLSPPSVPGASPAARSRARSPFLQSAPDESEDFDDEPRYPEARRGSVSGSERFRLAAMANRRQASVGEDDRLISPNNGVASTPMTNRAETASQREQGQPGAPQAAPEDESSATIEPVRLKNPPALLTPPTIRPATETSDRDRFGIERLSLCREVRGFDDLVEIDPHRLRSQRPILVYTSLVNYRSLATGEGYRTMTRSLVELQTVTGEVVWRDELGSATDLSSKPRHEYYLTHRIAIPASVPEGNYILSVETHDLLGGETSQARMAVCVHGGS